MNATHERVRELFTYEDGQLLRKIPAKRGPNTGRSLAAGNYRTLRVDNKTEQVHRLVWLYFFEGPLPEQLDHIDQNTGNNRIENLRAATRLQNSGNRSKFKSNKAGYKGIIKERGSTTFRAHIGAGRALVHLGNYPDADTAAMVYNEAALAWFGEFAFLNDNEANHEKA